MAINRRGNGRVDVLENFGISGKFLNLLHILISYLGGFDLSGFFNVIAFNVSAEDGCTMLGIHGVVESTGVDSDYFHLITRPSNINIIS